MNHDVRSRRPKGSFDIGLPSKSSLFQIFAGRIARLQQLATIAALEAKTPLQPGGVKLLWLVMTSPPNDASTRRFFAANHFFGLDRQQVVFFVQTTLPAFSPEGRILLATAGTIAESPDGNGAIYASMAAAGILTMLETRNIQYTHVHAVDNVLSMVSSTPTLPSCRPASQLSNCLDARAWAVLNAASPNTASVDGRLLLYADMHVRCW